MKKNVMKLMTMIFAAVLCCMMMVPAMADEAAEPVDTTEVTDTADPAESTEADGTADPEGTTSDTADSAGTTEPADTTTATTTTAASTTAAADQGVGTVSNIIGIIVAIVIGLGAIVAIVMLAPKKAVKKK